MVLTAPVVVAVLVAVAVGAVLQRLSGTGMGLVLAPVLTLVLGAASGVLVANATTTMSAALMLWALRRDVEWRRVGLVCAFAVPGAVIGAWVVRHSTPAWLQVIVGAVVVLAIGVTVLADALGRMPRARGPWVTPLAGLLGAVFNTTAGVAAPVMVVHARLVRWDQRAFAASMQPVFCWMGLLSVVVKSLSGAAHAGLPPWWLLPAVLATVLAGIRVGAAVQPHVSAERARQVAIVLAGLGGLSALVRGLLALG